MSKQSDIELLEIQAVEKYAKVKGISAQETIKKFHDCNLFEKMLIQHEYLHQVTFEEVFEFVENVTRQEEKEIIVYHGTTDFFEDIDLNKSKNRRDFGKGFYTTILESQAKEWAYRLGLRNNKKEYYVYSYTIKDISELKVKRFDAIDPQWLEFIKKNRSAGGIQHDFDIVIGPVADDNTMETIQLYMAGILKASEAMERLRYSKVNNQISFHTQAAVQCLELKGRKKYV